MPIQDQTSTLRTVLVRPPVIEDLGAWADFGWRTAPDPARAVHEHAAFREQLRAAGAEVMEATTAVSGDPDAIYAYDPLLLTEAGAILLRLGKPGRRNEPSALALAVAAAGIAIVGELHEPATAEGGDLFWLDPGTLLAGRGYRTNDDGISDLRGLLAPAGVEVIAFDLPHLRGAGECLHLMSLLSPLDLDLVVAYPPLMPVRLCELLRDRGIEIVEVPEGEFDTMGPNVLALGPRVALALEGNPETRLRMQAAGVEVRTYAGDEISRKGGGGPTCLTRPLERG
jgi:N-dimethylarginine dimethylaminohydrolase